MHLALSYVHSVDGHIAVVLGGTIDLNEVARERSAPEQTIEHSTPAIGRVLDSETRRRAIRAMEMVAGKDGRLERKRAGKIELQKHADILVGLGLAKAVATSEGVGYEVTGAGSRFLEEYEDIKHHSSPVSKIDTHPIPSQLVKNKVTVVIPTLDEAEALPTVIEELRAEGYERILVVDGYSTDGTTHLAKANGVKVVYQHGSGKAGAVKTAMERVETPYMLFMDGDHTYDPTDIWRLLNHNKRYAHVIGVRDRRQMSRLHRLGNWIISLVFTLLFAVKTTDVCSGMYLLVTEQAKRYMLEEPGFSAEVELAAQSALTGNLTEVPISYRARIGAGKLKTWKHGVAILFSAFNLARRYNPILFYSGLTGLSIVPAILILSWVALQQLTAQVWHSGWALVGTVLLLVAAQAFTLASMSILTRHMEKRMIQEIRSR